MWKFCRLIYVTGHILIIDTMDHNPASRIKLLLRFEEIFSFYTDTFWLP